MKKFILNADDFGKNADYNRAVLNGYNNGFLRSASLVANGEAFETAINEILPECQHLTIGVHLNLTEGKPLTQCEHLIDNTGEFNNSFLSLIHSINNKILMSEVEQEFRAQIEKVKGVSEITHIDSVSHVHMIPKLFELVCKLAIEYDIPYIRIIHEEFYYLPNFKYLLNPRFFINIFKLIRLNTYAKTNRTILNNFGLKSSNYTLGTGFSGMIDKYTIEAGLNALSDEDEILVECFIHPCSYLRNVNDTNSNEFKLTQDKILEDTIKRKGYEIINHKI